MSSDEELAFVIDHYRLPIPAAARQLILRRARLSEERQRRSSTAAAPAAGAGATPDEHVADRNELRSSGPE